MSYVKDANEFVKLIEGSPLGHEWMLRQIEERKLLLLAGLLDILLAQNGIDTDETTSGESIREKLVALEKFEKLVKEQETEKE